MCLLLLLVIAHAKSDSEERTCLNPNSLQNPKLFFAFLIFSKIRRVGAKIRRALIITTDALFPTLSSREERVKLCRVGVFVRLFLCGCCGE